jgi:hypothetical protein
MSEIQNRAIQMFHAQPDGTPITTEEFRQQMLQASLALYRALGGTEAEAHELVKESVQRRPGTLDASVGDVMVALAGVSYLQDMDMMQAAYNTLRRRFRQIQLVSCAAE